MPSRTIDDLDHVEHACLVPESSEHVWEATAAWVASGLRAGERVIYFEDETADLLLDRLADDRVPVQRARDDGQFVLVPTEQTRATVSVPLDQVEGVMAQAIGETVEQGWPGMRFIGESARGRMGMGLDTLVAYEETIDRVLRENPIARLLCLYDRRTFDDQAVEAMRRVHRAELVQSAVYDDGLVRVTRPAAATWRLAGEIDHSNSDVLTRTVGRALDHVLHAVDGPGDVTLDLGSLRFLDVAGTVELVHGARRFPEGRRLVLTGARPRVRRVLERCGAVGTTQLLVSPRWDDPDGGLTLGYHA